MKINNLNVAVIVPVFNEAKVITQTVESVLQSFPLIVCVDDGSSDRSANEILKTDALLVRHAINAGQGAALQTGIEFALLQYPQVEYIVTFDADGQHNMRDAKRMLRMLRQQNLDIVLGSRFLGSAPNITPLKRIVLRAAVQFTNLISRSPSSSGAKFTDTHNGLRVFNRAFAEALSITMPGMAHASEILEKVGRGNWRYAEMPVTIQYTDYSRAKGQSILNSINIVVDLLLLKGRQ